MKEIIYNIDNATAGRVITLTGLTEELGANNVLGIINKTTKKVLYAPTVGALSSVTYSSGTLTITLADSVSAITAGDKLLVKLYSDSDLTVAQIQSGLAKETSVKDGNDTAVSVGKEVRSEVGTGSDTAAETGTLSAVLKWTKNKVKDIYTAVTGITGYALQGSDSTKSITTLDADLGDVAAALEYMEQGGMPQIAQIAKQGTNANANISEIQALIGYTITEIDSI